MVKYVYIYQFLEICVGDTHVLNLIAAGPQHMSIPHKLERKSLKVNEIENKILLALFPPP